MLTQIELSALSHDPMTFSPHASQQTKLQQE